MYVSVYVNTGSQSLQKNMFYSLKQELQKVISHLMWVLGTELRSCARTVNVLSY